MNPARPGQGDRTEVVFTMPPRLGASLPTTIGAHVRSTRPALQALISGARREVLVYAPYADDLIAEELGPAIAEAARGGATCQVVTENPSRAPRPERLFRRLTALASVAPGRGELRLGWLRGSVNATSHAKVVCVDRDAAYVGSGNLTRRALTANLEAGLIVRGPSAATVCDAMQWYLDRVGVEWWLHDAPQG